MKNKVFVLLTIYILFLLRCASSPYNQARKIDTINAYETFLKEHSESPDTSEALKRLEELYFKKARQINSFESYNTFLKKYPYGLHAEKAKARIDWLYFKQADQKGTVSALEQFIERYPSNKYISTAKDHIEKIYFEQALQEGTIKALELFTKKYPSSQWTLKAKYHIEKSYFEQAAQEGTVNAFERFFTKYPYSQWISKSVQKIYIDAAKKYNSIESYCTYLKRFQKGIYSKEALERVFNIINQSLLKIENSQSPISELKSISKTLIDNSPIIYKCKGGQSSLVFLYESLTLSGRSEGSLPLSPLRSTRARFPRHAAQADYTT